MLAESTPPTDDLAAAMKKSDLLNSQAQPFQMDVDFVGQADVPQQGHLRLSWAAKDRWRLDVTMGDYKQVQIHNGEMEYTLRNAPFTPMRVGDLINLLHFAADRETLVVKKVKHRNGQGVALTCYRAGARGYPNDEREFCVADGQGVVTSVDSEISAGEIDREVLGGYAAYDGYFFPHELVLMRNGREALRAEVTGLTAVKLDEALLKPPPGSIERRKCANWRPPKPVSTPDPSYPLGARANRMVGDVVVAITVETDGSVSDIQLIGRSAHDMDDATMKQLKEWRFAPATCGNEAVVADIHVVVNFRLY